MASASALTKRLCIIILHTAHAAICLRLETAASTAVGWATHLRTSGLIRRCGRVAQAVAPWCDRVGNIGQLQARNRQMPDRRLCRPYAQDAKYCNVRSMRAEA